MAGVRHKQPRQIIIVAPESDENALLLFTFISICSPIFYFTSLVLSCRMQYYPPLTIVGFSSSEYVPVI